MRRCLAIFLLTAIFLCGCCSVDEEIPGQPRVVNAVSASYESGSIRLQRDYADGEKMRGVLDYLRMVHTIGPAKVDPETVSGSRIQIILYFSDGSRRVYDQWSDQFFRSDGGPWHSILPEKGQELALILGLTQSD